MILTRLRLANLRLFESLDLELAPGWNLFTGGNGAGKTTILEAACLLSHGRSFRSASHDALVRAGCAGYSVYGDIELGEVAFGVGIARDSGRLQARVAGQTVPVGELMRQTAVLCFEPGSHDLLGGGSEGRRRFLDWGVFHVEHELLPVWSRYQRALRQRNALLRAAASDAELAAWNNELARSGEPLSAMRQRYFTVLAQAAEPLLDDLLAELGPARLSFSAGHDLSQPLLDELERRQGRDRERGHTTRGPHRADWSLSFERAPSREHWSRGQEKLAAFALLMAQAGCHAASHRRQRPVLCLDDVASEIDQAHLRRVLDMVERSGSQVLVTATEPIDLLTRRAETVAVFHVEQATAQRLL